jgi:hypothetical protein
MSERPAIHPSLLPLLKPAQYAANAANGGQVIATKTAKAFSSSMMLPNLSTRVVNKIRVSPFDA